jgi:hypothetical protein
VPDEQRPASLSASAHALRPNRSLKEVA